MTQNFLDLPGRPESIPDIGVKQGDESPFDVQVVQRIFTGTSEQTVLATRYPSTNCTVAVNQNSDTGLSGATLNFYSALGGIEVLVKTVTLQNPADSTPRQYTWSSSAADYYRISLTPVASMTVAARLVVIGNGIEQAATAGTVTLAGDVTGPANANIVGTISGTTPIVISPNEFRWKASATPLLDQTISTTGAGATFTIAAQSAKAGSAAAGGVLQLQSGTKDGAAADGNINFFVGAARALYLGDPVGANQYTLNFDGACLQAFIGMDQANSGAGNPLQVSAQNAATGSGLHGGNIYIISGLGDGAGVAGQVILQTFGSFIMNATGGLQWDVNNTTPTISQAVSAGAGTAMSMSAQAAGATANTGGSLTLSAGAGTTSGSGGALIVNSGASPSGTSGNLTLNVGNGSSFGTVQFQFNAVNVLTLSQTGTLQFARGDTAIINQATAAASTSATAFALTAQAGGGTSGNTVGGELDLTAGAAGNGNAVGGNIVLTPGASLGTAAAAQCLINLTAPPGAGAEGYVVVQRGGSNRLLLGALIGTLTTGAVYPNVTASATNYGVALNTTDGLFNAPTTTLRLQVAATDIIQIVATDVRPQIATMTWAETLAPVISEKTRTTDAAANAFTIQAQSAQTTASVNLNGGNLVLQGGAAKTNGSSGTRGAVRVEIGADTAEVMIEAAEVAVGQRVVALAQLSTGVTATQVPANAGDGVVWVANAATAPTTGTPVGGGLLFSAAGAGKWKGTSGTVTTFGPADLEGFHGHCPQCGTDFAHEWKNEKYGSLTICMHCLAEELGDRPWIVRKR